MVNNLLWTGGGRQGCREGKKNIEIKRYFSIGNLYPSKIDIDY